jgi:hypothetical protein
MWWTTDPFWIYRVELAAEAPPGVTAVEVRLRPSGVGATEAAP